MQEKKVSEQSSSSEKQLEGAHSRSKTQDDSPRELISRFGSIQGIRL
jgi:hypothetical protein